MEQEITNSLNLGECTCLAGSQESGNGHRVVSIN